MRAVLKSPECRKFFLTTSTFPQYWSPAYTHKKKTMLFLPIDKKRRQIELWEDVCCSKKESTNLFILYANSILSLLGCAGNGISPRFPIALPILYTISKATSVGTKPTARNIAASPGFITQNSNQGAHQQYYKHIVTSHNWLITVDTATH